MAIILSHSGTHASDVVPSKIRKVDGIAPNRWLSAGIQDFKESGVSSLLYGLLFVIAGAVTIWFTQSNVLFVMAIVTGFYLVGPLVATGIYDMSRRIEIGEKPSLLHAVSVLGNHTRCLMGLILILGALMLAWTASATVIVNLFFDDPSVVTGGWQAMTSGSQTLPFTGVLFLGGIILALLASGISLTFLPLLNQRQIGTVTVLVILAMIMLVWVRAMVMAITAFTSDVDMLSGGWSALISEAQFLPFLVVFLLVGLVFAGIAFTISVVAVPLIIDRRINVFSAISTSLEAVRKNPMPMFRWAATIAVLIAIGLGFFFIGLAITMPIIGHASWHAYRELIVAEEAKG